MSIIRDFAAELTIATTVFSIPLALTLYTLYDTESKWMVAATERDVYKDDAEIWETTATVQANYIENSCNKHPKKLDNPLHMKMKHPLKRKLS